MSLQYRHVALILIAHSSVVAAQDIAPPSLADIFKAAASDLVFSVPPQRRTTTRFLSLHGIPEADRAKAVTALQFLANGTSIRGDLAKLTAVGDLLVRVDLPAFGWDVFSRELELEKLAALGVDLKFKRASDRRYYTDIWEFMAYFEPFFRGNPGVDPTFASWVAKVAGTEHLVLSAHWLLPRLWLERVDGGFFSQLLVLPPTQADLEKRLGVDRRFAKVDPRAVHGAAVIKSASVAYQNREIQALASATGFDQHWYAITNDFNDSGDAAKDVRESPAGTSKPDAHEMFFSLPNGFLGVYLSNAQGVQAAFAPQQVAEDQRPAPANGQPYYSPTKTVFTPGKCFDCHGENRGLLGFDDAVIKLFAPERLDTAYVVQDKDKRSAAIEAIRLEEFYRKGLKEKIEQYRVSYEARVRECTGLDVMQTTRLALEMYDKYTPVYASVPVTPEQAAKEVALALPVARALWKASGESALSILAAGQPIVRKRWEATAPATFHPRLKKAG